MYSSLLYLRALLVSAEWFSDPFKVEKPDCFAHHPQAEDFDRTAVAFTRKGTALCSDLGCRGRFGRTVKSEGSGRPGMKDWTAQVCAECSYMSCDRTDAVPANQQVLWNGDLRLALKLHTGPSEAYLDADPMNQGFQNPSIDLSRCALRYDPSNDRHSFDIHVTVLSRLSASDRLNAASQRGYDIHKDPNPQSMWKQAGKTKDIGILLNALYQPLQIPDSGLFSTAALAQKEWAPILTIANPMDEFNLKSADSLPIGRTPRDMVVLSYSINHGLDSFADASAFKKVLYTLITGQHARLSADTGPSFEDPSHLAKFRSSLLTTSAQDTLFTRVLPLYFDQGCMILSCDRRPLEPLHQARGDLSALVSLQSEGVRRFIKSYKFDQIERYRRYIIGELFSIWNEEHPQREMQLSAFFHKLVTQAKKDIVSKQLGFLSKPESMECKREIIIQFDLADTLFTQLRHHLQHRGSPKNRRLPRWANALFFQQPMTTDSSGLRPRRRKRRREDQISF